MRFVPEIDRTLVKFADIEIGWPFIDDGIVFMKLRDADPDDPLDRGLARGPKCGLGNGMYEFQPDAEVEPA